MIRKLFVCQSDCHDPYRNLALEQYLLETVERGQCILYLWQNEHTVVIGRNQNPWKECAVSALERDGGRLVRRLSGGGAVYHDLGNLNFTFLMPQEDFDLDRQFGVILHAMSLLGIPTERSGRNDLLAAGRKFSGNAFYKNGRQAYHHGTLLVDADPEKMNRYLTPSKAKLEGKGVDSVRSRIVNLRELRPNLTVDAVKNAMMDAFSAVYGYPTQQHAPVWNLHSVEEMTRRNTSWDWNFGKQFPFSTALEDRFGWGGICLQLQVEAGMVRHAQVFTDAMDHTLADKLRHAVIGCRFARKDLCESVQKLALPEGEDIQTLFGQI